MRIIYFLILVILLGILSGCLEYEVEEGTATTTSSTSSTTSSTTTTTAPLIISTTTSSSTTTLSKISYSCDDFCKKEGYKGGKCRKTAAQCRRYGINEIYQPSGNKYCPKGRGDDACCCLYSLPTTSSTSTTTTILAKKESIIEGFGGLRPLDNSVEYKPNGLFSAKILNTVGTKVEITDLNSGECQGVGLGSLDQLELKEGGETRLRAWCEKKEEGEEFSLNLTFTYKEIFPSGVEVYYKDSRKIQGYVENEMS